MKKIFPEQIAIALSDLGNSMTLPTTEPIGIREIKSLLNKQ